MSLDSWKYRLSSKTDIDISDISIPFKLRLHNIRVWLCWYILIVPIMNSLNYRHRHFLSNIVSSGGRLNQAMLCKFVSVFVGLAVSLTHSSSQHPMKSESDE